LVKTLEKISVYSENKMTFSQLKADFENHFEDFELFWFSKPIQALKNSGLIAL
jgi:hypothetical protein